MSTEAYVPTRPLCDVCKHEEATERPAFYDGATVRGSWAYMCEEHFETHGRGLGTGRGQKLIVGEKPERSRDDIAREVGQAIRNGASYDDLDEIIGDGDLADYL